MCVYDKCPYSCFSKLQHRARFAKFKKTLNSTIHLKSSKVNWDIVFKLNMQNLIRKRLKLQCK